uniref:Uncharacterized protein n=1 Tax=Anguilla anguilla TaxID=7936 RepID=A0A0E9QUR4_ANGAN
MRSMLLSTMFCSVILQILMIYAGLVILR